MLKEKLTRKFEIDECNCHIHVRETTTIIDSKTGDVKGASAHHRYVIPVGDDAKIKELGLEKLAEQFWTEKVREAIENNA